MGEEPGTARASVAADNKDPEQIREEIEATRQELGDTVEALAAKADVKARVRGRIEATKESAAQKLGRAREASPDGVASGASQATQKARENPIPVAAVGAFAAGFVFGRLAKRP
jgi:ElaB/YqjD/DUF883 family membrane-anchored ribosome-binding protein